MSGLTISRTGPALSTRQAPAAEAPSAASRRQSVEAAHERHAWETDDLRTGRKLAIWGSLALTAAAAASVSVFADSVALEAVAAAVAACSAVALGLGAKRYYDRRLGALDADLRRELDRAG